MKLVLTIALSLAFSASAFAAVKCPHKFNGGLSANTNQSTDQQSASAPQTAGAVRR